MAKAGLRRELGLASATIMGISVIVGAGIYAIIGAATGIAGSGVWLSFLVAAFVALLTGLSYAELSSMFPGSGSSFTYVFRGLGSRLLGFITGWLILFEAVVGAAAIAIAFGNYFASVFTFPVMAAAFVCILLFSAINMVGIKESMAANTIMFILEVGGLIFVIIAGFLFGTVHPNLMDFQLTPVLAGAALVFFAMLGFEMIASESEEAKDARHTIPMAIVLSIIICAFLYVAFAIAALMLVGPDVLGSSSAPVKDVVYPLLGDYALIFSIIAIASTGNTVLICLITASRLSYGMAKENSLPGFLSAVNKRFRTPHMAVLASFAVALLFLLLADMVVIAEVTNFAALLAFFLINASVVKLRMDYPNEKRPFMMPLAPFNIPLPAVLGALASLFLIAYLSLNAIAYGIILVAIGAAVHMLMPREHPRRKAAHFIPRLP